MARTLIDPHVGSRVRRFLERPAGPPAVMLVAALAGLVWANADSASYEHFFDLEFSLGVSDIRVDEDLHGWVNDGAMTLFFFAVGLEIKRELVVGELQDRRRAMLPVLAAVGGMIAPAGLYLAVNALAAEGDASGWAVPVATDIAFTLGVLSLLGARVPVHLRLFVLALAIVDDVGGVVIIAVAFSDGIDTGYLGAAIGALGVVILMQQLRLSSPLLYVPVGIAVWYCAGRSGIEPTIAGVALGMLTPARPFGGRSVLEALEHRIAPVTALIVLPAFALANTGIPFSGSTLADAASNPVAVGIVVGLVVGKTIGITAASWLALRSGLGSLHETVPFKLVVPAALLAGIGFTVALFVADLSFDDPGALDQAKIAILTGSGLAATTGYIALRAVHTRVRATPVLTDEVHHDG